VHHGYQVGVYSPAGGSALATDLRGIGFDVHELSELRSGQTAVVVVEDDLSDPGLVRKLQLVTERSPTSQLIVLSPAASTKQTSSALRQGAFWVLPTNCPREELCLVLTKACVVHELAAENERLKSGLAVSWRPTELVADSPVMREILAQAERIAGVDSTTLITGESGTGKSSLARVIHQKSNRAEGPFVSLSCAAIPRDLLEAELFGHERGAFTGAVASRAGSIELADGGTLFLDEIGDLPLELQPKLLAFLQDRTIRRIGANRLQEVDVRVIAATNHNLAEMCRERRFREELYYRLHVLALHMPPLRARREDVVPLARFFCDSIARKRRVPPFRLEQEAVALLQRHLWPGNVRELENTLERAATFCRDSTIRASDLKGLVVGPESAPSAQNDADALSGTLAEIEARAIRRALVRCGGDKVRAARELGVSLKTIYNKLRKL